MNSPGLYLYDPITDKSNENISTGRSRIRKAISRKEAKKIPCFSRADSFS